MASFFDGVALAPPNPIFNLTAMFKADGDANKINLGVGAYRTDEGVPWVLPVVKKAERALLERVEAGDLNHEYLPIAGLRSFVTASMALAFGDDSPSYTAGQVDGVQALSGTGALRMVGEYVSKQLKIKNIFVPNLTWGNHMKIFQLADMTVSKYRYYNKSTCGLDFEGYLDDLKNIPSESAILIHACAHNPTGVDPTKEQWEKIAKIVQERHLLVIFDSAYQGFASGSVENDGFAIRLFDQMGMNFFLCQSYSKNFGLYNERCGCVCVKAASKDEANAVRSQLELVIRPMYSNPPSHGAQIVSHVLNNPELKAEWFDNIKTMSSRIQTMRELLLSKLTEKGTPPPGTPDWSHVTRHIGMFTFTGLSEKQVAFITEKYHIYLLKNGRINMCGVTPGNCEHLASAIHDAMTTSAL